MALSKEELLAKLTDLPVTVVDDPDLGEVRLRMMTAKDRDEFENSLFKVTDAGTVESTGNDRAQLLARCIVDDDNQRLFTGAEVEQLGAGRADIIARLYSHAQKMNRIGPGAEAEAKGNSDAAPSGDSSSD